MAENCPFCGAAPADGRHDKHVDWFCGSGFQRDEPWQSEACKLNVAEADNDRLREELKSTSWEKLMMLLDTYWPADVFPTLVDDVDRDTGPRIVSLLRWVERLKTELARRDEALEKRLAEEEDVIKVILLVNVRNDNQRIHDELNPKP